MQITDHIHALKIPFQMKINPRVSSDRFTYVYLIYGKNICLVDTGVSGSETVIFDYIRKTGRTPEEISLIVHTHSHPDHIGADRAIKESTGCRVAAHVDAISWIEDVEKQLIERPVPHFYSLVGGPVKVDQALKDEDNIILDDDLQLQVYHTPGHSSGSICLLLQQAKTLFSGDAIPISGDAPIYDNILESVKSIKKLKNIPGINYLLAAWDDPREGEEVYTLMDESLQYLQQIHRAVMKHTNNSQQVFGPTWCKSILGELEIPPAYAAPLVTRSFKSHLDLPDDVNIFDDGF